MATRSLIAMEKGDKVRYIYCHNNGSVRGVGRILHEHYQSEEKVLALMSLGDISVLGAELEPPEAVKRFGSVWMLKEEFRALNKKERDRLRKEAEGVTFTEAYHRDYGDPLIKQTLSVEKFNEVSIGQEYIYTLRDGKWWVRHISHPDEHPLEEVIQQGRAAVYPRG